MSEEKGADVVKWYTRARKFPKMIGRTPDGAKVWGGPYTITQAIVGGVLFFIGVHTMPLWARYGLIGNCVLGALTIWGCVWGLGKIPIGSRNPFSVAAGTWQALSAPRTGRVGGRPVRIRRPHQVRHQIRIADLHDLHPGPGAELATATEPTPPRSTCTRAAAASPVPSPEAQPRRQPALTGVQALLAGKHLSNEESHR